ncbi:MAG: TMAO reductase system periplasmic protein TorT [Gammaproteobacteria bacterium]|nr:TMAO reductase system periplasmic protein TorT [Gammaproteobacteria bacterium]
MRTLTATLFLALFCTTVTAEWSPLQVDVWNPPFNSERKHLREPYTALAKAGKQWHLCVAIPHLKDAYWLAANYGLVEHAKQLGVHLTIQAAGGYDKLEKQREQVEKCFADGADALILGAIQGDGFADLIAKFTAGGKPVIDLINGISSPLLSARVAADFFEMGKAAGEYAVNHVVAGEEMKVGWLPGPQGAGWSAAGDQGFRAALVGKPLKIVADAWGDTGVAAQSKLVAAMLDAHPDLDMIAGTAVSAEAAVQELRRRKLSDRVKVIAYYFAPAVHRGIQRGGILAAPSDVPGLQARLAVDVAVRALEQQPFPRHLSAPIELIDAVNVKSIDLSGSLAPEGFRPIFSVN